MATDDEQSTEPQRPPIIPPIPGLRPLTEAEVTRLKQLAERGQRSEEIARQLTHDDDAQQQPNKEQPTNG